MPKERVRRPLAIRVLAEEMTAVFGRLHVESEKENPRRAVMHGEIDGLIPGVAAGFEPGRQMLQPGPSGVAEPLHVRIDRAILRPR